MDEALELARAIGDKGDRAFILMALGRRDEVLVAMRAINESSNVRALAALGRMDEALVAARAMRDEEARAFALRELVPQLAAAGRLDEALVAARAMGMRGPAPSPWRTWARWMRPSRRPGRSGTTGPSPAPTPWRTWRPG